ncbi:MAG: helix-turn-helix transcriptional regulator [Rubrivivax sp.]|nr:helix-turn-helix transcriptional regulator [Rubrivivax sp.]
MASSQHSDVEAVAAAGDSHAAAAERPAVARMVEDIVGCKWSLAVLGAVRRGIHRPGALEHAIEGLSKKVLNERLAKLVRFGILDKHSFAELPPRVEYRLTGFGAKFCALLDGIDALQRELGAPRTEGGRAGPLASRA